MLLKGGAAAPWQNICLVGSGCRSQIEKGQVAGVRKQKQFPLGCWLVTASPRKPVVRLGTLNTNQRSDFVSNRFMCCAAAPPRASTISSSLKATMKHLKVPPKKLRGSPSPLQLEAPSLSGALPKTSNSGISQKKGRATKADSASHSDRLSQALGGASRLLLLERKGPTPWRLSDAHLSLFIPPPERKELPQRQEHTHTNPAIPFRRTRPTYFLRFHDEPGPTQVRTKKENRRARQERARALPEEATTDRTKHRVYSVRLTVKAWEAPHQPLSRGSSRRPRVYVRRPRPPTSNTCTRPLRACVAAVQAGGG